MRGFGVSEVAVVISVCQCPPMPPMELVSVCGCGQIPIRSGFGEPEMAIPTSVYVSMVNLWKLPVWQSPQDNINFFLELDASWILRAMHVRGALL